MLSNLVCEQELDELGFWRERNWSRSRSVPEGKPLDDRSRSSHLELLDFPVEIEEEQSIIV